MSNHRVAIRYAKAILDFSKEQNSLDETYANMQLIETTIAENVELQNALNNSIVKLEVKKNILLAVFEGNINTVSKKLIDLLISNKRIAYFGAVASQFVTLYDVEKGKQTATVTTAIPLTDALKTQVLAKVKELTGKEAILENKIDTTILGGFILRIGDIQYDASISNKLNSLKRQFSA
ncbi:MAG: ATP synthase F1 subunit delta [Flavobacteriaceae bacterium]|nr:ATP synthase F1 subunit delta [Flavobacteriaceae bacterium]